MNEMRSRTRILSEGAMVVALTIILKDILPPIYHFPQGGSVSAAGMVPILWYALRRGPYAGLEVGGIYGLVNMMFGGYFVDPVQALLDYPIAFAALGLAGFLKAYPLIGVILGIAGRFFAHFISGVWFFSMYTPEGINPIVYSAVYNGSYLIAELVISLIIIFLLQKRRLLELYL